MKLPQSRKERIQVFVLAGMGLAAMLFAVFSLLNSQRARLRRNALEAAQITESLANAEKEVRAMVLAVDDYKQLQAEIGAAVSNDIVQPVLGSYLLSVRDRVEQAARRSDVKLTGIQEVGLQVLPVVAGAPSRTFRSYVIQAIGTAGYAQLRNFLRELEISNAYLSITEVGITGNAGDPRIHRISVRIEWPVLTGDSIPGAAGGAKGGFRVQGSGFRRAAGAKAARCIWK